MKDRQYNNIEYSNRHNNGPRGHYRDQFGSDIDKKLPITDDVANRISIEYSLYDRDKLVEMYNLIERREKFVEVYDFIERRDIKIVKLYDSIEKFVNGFWN